MKRYKKWLYLILILVATIACAVPAAVYARNNADKLQIRRDSRMSPVIMIPGSSASVNRFDTLVQKAIKEIAEIIVCLRFMLKKMAK